MRVLFMNSVTRELRAIPDENYQVRKLERDEFDILFHISYS